MISLSIGIKIKLKFFFLSYDNNNKKLLAILHVNLIYSDFIIGNPCIRISKFK